MAATRKQKTAPAEAASKKARRVPKEVVAKSGKREHLTSGQEEALKMERQEYRHGGIPVGSDPRE